MRALHSLFARAVDHGDAVLVALLVLAAVIAAAVSGAPLGDPLLVPVSVLPLLARRRAPLPVLIVVLVAPCAGDSRGDRVGGSIEAAIALDVALYSVAAHCGRRRAIVGAVIVAAFELAYTVPALVESGSVLNVLVAWSFMAGVWALGRWVRERR